MTAEQYCNSILDHFGQTDKQTILDLMEGYAAFKYMIAVEIIKKKIIDIVEKESFHLNDEVVLSVPNLLIGIVSINGKDLLNG